MRRLQNQLVLVYVVVVLGYLLLTLSFYLASFRPLAEQLKHEHRSEIQFAMASTAGLIEAIFDRHHAMARQTASRTAIRDMQARFLADEISRAEFEDFSLDKLADALRANDEMLGIQRHAPDGEVLLRVGRVPPRDHLPPCDVPASGKSSILGVMPLEHQVVLVFCSAIDLPDAGRVGFDLVFMDTASLQQVLDRPQYHDLTTIAFGLADQEQRLLFWPSSLAETQGRNLLQHHLRSGESLPSGYLLETHPLEGSRFVLHALVDEQRFFSSINQQLGRLIVVLLFWGVVILIATLLGLRRLLHRAIEVRILTQQVQRDGMTGLFNHDHLQQQLEREIARNHRYRSGFSLLLIDIDHFKRVNDEYGHQLGDQVLKEVAAGMERVARSADLVARYGGEEFAIIMPESDPEGALQMAERLRSEVASQNHRVGSGRVAVTISIGVVSCPAGVSSPDREEMIRLADVALYTSKREGRNRVIQTVLKPG